MAELHQVAATAVKTYRDEGLVPKPGDIVRIVALEGLKIRVASDEINNRQMGATGVVSRMIRDNPTEWWVLHDGRCRNFAPYGVGEMQCIQRAPEKPLPEAVEAD